VTDPFAVLLPPSSEPAADGTPAAS
jgi:hypothetical protein